MATYTIYANTANGGRLQSSDSSYSTARSGGGTLSASSTQLRAGQFRGAVTSTIYEAFLEFDTSVLAGKTITSAKLECYLSARYIDVAFTIRARLRDFGSSLTTGDWVAGASLSSLTLLASLASGSTTVGDWNEFADTALAANINKTGNTRMLLCSSRTESGSSAANTDEYLVFAALSGDDRPRLVIETDENNGELSKTVGTIGLSTAGNLETFGNLGSTVGTIALSAAGEGATPGAGVLNQTVGGISLSAAVQSETNAYLEATVGTIFLTTGALLPLEGQMSATVSLGLSSVMARDTEGALSKTIGTILLTTSTSAEIEGALTATIGITLTAVESGPPWPSLYDFPQKPLDGTWRRERGDDTLRSDREVGARQYRAQNGGNYADATFAIMLNSKNALDLLDRFFRDDCKNGATSFYWIDPETGDNMAWLWAQPPQIRHVSRETYRVECALLKEAA